MSNEEDEKEYELKDLIVQTLEANGLLAKLKAQIRSSVFVALDETDKSTTTPEHQNSLVKKVLSTNEGRLGAALVREFLETCNLDYTLSVFDPEINSTFVLDKRDKLIGNLNMNDNELNKDTPLLISYLKRPSEFKSSNGRTDDIPSSMISTARAKFEKMDTNKRGSLDKDKVKIILSELFPNFSRVILESYLNDELDFALGDSLKGIDYTKYIALIKKWYFSCQNTLHSNVDPFEKTTTSNQNNKNYNSDLLDLFSNTSNNNSSNKQNNNKKQEEKDPFSFNNDDFPMFSTTKPKSNNEQNNKGGLSSLGDLPPLNSTVNNKKSLTSIMTKDYDKKHRDHDDDNYDDDFTSGTTPRTPVAERKMHKNRGGINSDEEIEDNLSYVEESSKLDEMTIDKSISTIQENNDADYIEDVSI